MADTKTPDQIVYSSDPVVDAAMRAEAWKKYKKDHPDQKQPRNPGKSQARQTPRGQKNIQIADGGPKIPSPLAPLGAVQDKMDEFYLERQIGGAAREYKLAAERFAKSQSQSNRDAVKSWREQYGSLISQWEKMTGRTFNNRIDTVIAEQTTPKPTKQTGATGPRPSLPPMPSDISSITGPTGAAKGTSTTTASTPTIVGGYGSYKSASAGGSDLALIPATHKYGAAAQRLMGKTNEQGLAYISTGDASNTFLKGITTGDATAQMIVDRMVKAGLVKKNASPAILANAYENALAWNAKVLGSGNATYSIFNAINDLGKASKSQAGGGAGGTGVSIQRRVYTQDEVRSVGDSVAQNLLGRLLTDDEVAKAMAAINKESKAHPQKTVTSYHGRSSSSTTSGGIDPQAMLERTTSQTAESQAYTTNKLFNDAMSVLASRIG